MKKIEVFGFIGLGLIGGTIARAVRNTIPGARIYAFDPDRTSLQEAVRDGVADKAFPVLNASFGECDMIFLCAPVSHNIANLKILKPFLKDDVILTDVGSVKSGIHRAVREEGLQASFIGGHPMTGSERTGYRNSRAELLENAYYILSPEPEFPPELTEWMTEFVVSLGAIPLPLTSSRHDYATAAVSHVPHVISASLVHLVEDSDSPEGVLRTIAAGGFKDITRITGSSPVMWQQICLSNRDNILKLIDDYVNELTRIRGLIDQKEADAIYNWFDSARRYRDTFSDLAGGQIYRIFETFVDIPDRPGVLAEVFQILAEAGINIKNLNINHNREYQEGVLRIEFNTRKDLDHANWLLADHGFAIH